MAKNGMKRREFRDLTAALILSAAFLGLAVGIGLALRFRITPPVITCPVAETPQFKAAPEPTPSPKIHFELVK